MRYFIARQSKSQPGRIAIVPDLSVKLGKTITPVQFETMEEAVMVCSDLSDKTGDTFFPLRAEEVTTVEAE
jgi:hypothetical protein